jgi:D-3-phosphoglycerate dehydrogenase / 2-oxoglutarate reductase
LDILITDPIHSEALVWLEGRHSVDYRPELANEPAALAKTVSNARVIVVGAQTKIGKSFLKAAPELQVVARTGPTTDNVDLISCAEKGIHVLAVQQPHAQSSCEFTLAALLVLLRGLPTFIAHPTHKTASYSGRELNGKTVGLVGLALTGRAMASLLQSFNVKVIGCDPTRAQGDPRWERLGIEAKSVDEVFAQSDAVCVQLEYGTAYANYIDAKVIAAAAPGLVLVSVSRSSVFDIPALAKALKSGRISSAWLDTVESVHMQTDSPLRGLDNLTITPRLSGRTLEAQSRVAWQVARKIDEFLVAHPPGTPVQPGFARSFSESRPFADSLPAQDPAQSAVPAPAAPATQAAPPAQTDRRMSSNPLLQTGNQPGESASSRPPVDTRDPASARERAAEDELQKVVLNPLMQPGR